jgi:hypothetical protein
MCNGLRISELMLENITCSQLELNENETGSRLELIENELELRFLAISREPRRVELILVNFS